MAAESRLPDPDVSLRLVKDAMRKRPGSFEFFQAVRLLERMQPDRRPIGSFNDPRREAARFAVNPSFSFPPSEIQAIEWNDSSPPRLQVNFMGLTGPVGVLPYVYTELVNERLRAKDRVLKDFLDIFHHRAISLFWRAWEKYRFPVAWERDQKDRVSQLLAAFLGLATGGLQNRQEVDDQALLYYTGLLSLHPRSAAALAQITGDYFHIPVRVDQFVGGWFRLPPDDQCMLGRESVSEQIGVAAIAGDAVWDQQSRVRLCLGPMALAKYRRFLPGGGYHEELEAIKRFFTNREFDFEVQLVLAKDEVPAFELGEEETSPLPLGWCSWLKTEAFTHDPGDAILPLGEATWA